MKRRLVDVRTVRTALNDCVNNTEDTAADIARQAGISKSAVSMFKSGKYKGDNAGIAEKLAPIVEERQGLTEITSGERELIYWIQYLTENGKLKTAKIKNEKVAQDLLDRYGKKAKGFTLWVPKNIEKKPILWPWAGKSDETNGD
jgi:hypothetical protein